MEITEKHFETKREIEKYSLDPEAVVPEGVMEIGEFYSSLKKLLNNLPNGMIYQGNIQKIVKENERLFNSFASKHPWPDEL